MKEESVERGPGANEAGEDDDPMPVFAPEVFGSDLNLEPSIKMLVQDKRIVIGFCKPVSDAMTGRINKEGEARYAGSKVTKSISHEDGIDNNLRHNKGETRLSSNAGGVNNKSRHLKEGVETMIDGDFVLIGFIILLSRETEDKEEEEEFTINLSAIRDLLLSLDWVVVQVSTKFFHRRRLLAALTKKLVYKIVDKSKDNVNRKQ